MTSDNTSRSPSHAAPARRTRRPLGRAGRVHTNRRDRDRERSRRLSPASSDRGRRKPSSSIVIFVGQARGGLSASQRADVMGMARDWVREGTGAIVADVPVDTPNARAAAATFQEIRSRARSRRRAVARHRPASTIIRRIPRLLPTIRLSYPRIAAVAGPCGLWPEDLGPSILDPGYNENRPYYNFGCATQRNLAAMIDNPADLEQPRSETPAYTARRNGGVREISQGRADRDHLSRSRQGQTQRHRQMISRARQIRRSRRPPPPADDYIAPAPRVSVQAFCETEQTAAAVRAAGEDRRLGKAHLSVQWAAWRPPSKPITTRRRRT